MPVVSRRRSVRILLNVAAAFPLLLAGGAAVLSVVIGQVLAVAASVMRRPQTAVRDIPASFLSIYEQVGAHYRLPWEVLAGIGKEECDHGRDPDPSCTPQPGARGPGVANCCGASGPMQIGIGGASGDSYDRLRRFLPDPGSGRMIRPRRCGLLRCICSSRPTRRPGSRSTPTAGDSGLQPRPRVRRPGGGRRDAYRGAGSVAVGAACSGASAPRSCPGPERESSPTARGRARRRRR